MVNKEGPQLLFDTMLLYLLFSIILDVNYFIQYIPVLDKCWFWINQYKLLVFKKLDVQFCFDPGHLAW